TAQRCTSSTRAAASGATPSPRARCASPCCPGWRRTRPRCSGRARAMAEAMPRRQAFLGRLAQLPRERALAEIARNLGHVFNIRKACGSVLPELGLGDYEREVNT